MKIITFFYTLVVRCLVVKVCGLAIIPFAISACIPQKYRFDSTYIYRMVNFFYWLILKVTGLSITYKGRENIPAEPVIFVANHQSSLDIPLVGLLAQHTPHIWLARHELTESLLLRWVLPIFAVIVDINSRHSSIASLRRVLSLISNKHRHLVIFPEGSRFADGQIHNFFGGFVVLAKMTGRSIVPVYVHRANTVYPRGAFLMHRHPITVVVGSPMSYTSTDTNASFKKRVHDWFIETAAAHGIHH